jgi:hypothetical protein
MSLRSRCQVLPPNLVNTMFQAKPFARIPLLTITLAGLALGLGSREATSQSAVEWDPRAAEVTREELTGLLGRLNEAASAPGYSGRLREQARQEAEYIRSRLEQGDFQVGDRVALHVRGEPQLSDTVIVTSGQQIELAQIGPVSLAGVLRSELESHLTTALGRFIQNPSVRANALVRIGVLGAVSRQGFYTLPATMLLEDVIMTAGGPAGRADLKAIVIERGDQTTWSGESLQRAMVEGRTLDQLSLRAGDRIVVPERSAGFFEGGVVRTLLVTIPPLLYLILQIT